MEAIAPDRKQLVRIDLGCRLASYWVDFGEPGQRCCRPVNADPLGCMKDRFLTSVRVKEDECLTHGVCESELPRIFHLPEDGGTARVLESALNHYTELQSEIERVAAEICPVEAIHLVYSDGSERFPPSQHSAVQAHTLGPNLWPWRVLAVLGFALVVLFLCSRA